MFVSLVPQLLSSQRFYFPLDALLKKEQKMSHIPKCFYHSTVLYKTEICKESLRESSIQILLMVWGSSTLSLKEDLINSQILHSRANNNIMLLNTSKGKGWEKCVCSWNLKCTGKACAEGLGGCFRQEKRVLVVAYEQRNREKAREGMCIHLTDRGKNKNNSAQSFLPPQ